MVKATKVPTGIKEGQAIDPGWESGSSPQGVGVGMELDSIIAPVGSQPAACADTINLPTTNPTAVERE